MRKGYGFICLICCLLCGLWMAFLQLKLHFLLVWETFIAYDFALLIYDPQTNRHIETKSKVQMQFYLACRRRASWITQIYDESTPLHPHCIHLDMKYYHKKSSHSCMEVVSINLFYAPKKVLQMWSDRNQNMRECISLANLWANHSYFSFFVLTYFIIFMGLHVIVRKEFFWKYRSEWTKVYNDSHFWLSKAWHFLAHFEGWN